MFRKVGNTLRESVFEQIAWAIDALGSNDLWASSVSPMQYVYKPTGQKSSSEGWIRQENKVHQDEPRLFLSTYGLRNWMSSLGLKKSEQCNNLFSVAAASLRFSNRSTRPSVAATGRMCTLMSRERTATGTIAIIQACRGNGWGNSLLMMRNI